MSGRTLKCERTMSGRISVTQIESVLSLCVAQLANALRLSFEFGHASELALTHSRWTHWSGEIGVADASILRGI